MLELKNVSKTVGAEVHIHPCDLVLQRGTLNVLLGPTLSGKTSLMRLMAGLDKPSGGSIHFDIDPARRHVLLEGLDDIAATMKEGAEIAAFEHKLSASRPWI